MTRRRALLARVQSGGGGRLPAEYQEVAYLESSGTQYLIVNSTVLNDGLTAEIDYMFTAPQSGDQYLFHSGGGGGLLSAECYIGYRWYAYCGLAVFSNVLNSVGNSQNVKYKLIMDSINGTINIDGRTANKTGTRSNYNIDSFSLFSGINGTNLNTGLRIYSLVLKNNGIESYNFVPCYRKSDSEPGMYDLVNNQFYTNVGTGEFLVGNNIN